MKPVQRAYLELHLAVFLFGLTAIFGDLIQLSAFMIVWWRVLFTSISLVFLIRVRHIFRTLPRKTILQLMGIGVIVGLHWVTFYGAVKMANVSMCLIGMSTTSVFTAFLEPWIFKEKIKWYEVFLSLLIVPGMILVVNSTDLALLDGLLMAILSALLIALFAILNRKMVSNINELDITFLELGSAWIFLTLLLPAYALINGGWPEIVPSRWLDFVYLVILALLCTTFAYVLALRALRFISAFASNLTMNMEPVYGIILAWILLKENQELDQNFYYGAVIILAAVFCYPFLRKILANRSAKA